MAKELPLQVASMVAMPKCNWEDLPVEIVAEIRERIELYDDYEAFLEVCSSWRLAIKNLPTQYVNRKYTQLPWLMLADPDDSSYRRYYSLTKHMFLKIDLPRPLSLPQTRRYFSSQGWLISVSRNIEKSTNTDIYFNISIFNPFANNNLLTIEAPLFHQNGRDVQGWEDDWLVSYFNKFAVSVSAKTEDKSDDFVVAMVFGGCSNLAYWRLGRDDSWNIVPYILGVKNTLFQDLNFFNGELYATQWESRVIALGSLKDNNPQPRVVVDMGYLRRLFQLPANMDDLGNNHYLVESKYNESGDEDNTSSTLLYIYRYIVVESYKEQKLNTSTFKVFKLNVYNGNTEQVKSLGNQAIFLGFNSSFAVVVEDERGGCKPDCIYYTDDFENAGVGFDMGIYSLPKDSTIPLYEGPSRFSVINRPFWIELSSAAGC